MTPAHLGELLALSQRSSADLERWLHAQGTLVSELREQARERRETLAQFVRIAVADFVAAAGEEEWTALLSSLRDAKDPGAACLARMAAFRARRDPPS
jgi:hypothetical protein